MISEFLQQQLTVILLLISNLSFSQTFDLVPSDIEKGSNPNIEMFVPVDDNSFIIIEKTTTKPMGLKPFLYSYDSESKTFTVTQISGLKHMQVYKKFWTEGFNILAINDRYFNVIIEYEKRKAKNHIFSVDLQEFDLETLESIADPIRVLESEQTTNDGRFYFKSVGDHFAIIKKGAGADIFTFSSESFELLYHESVSFTNDEQSGNISQVALDDKGKVFILYLFKESTNDKSAKNLKITEVSQEGATTNEFNSNEILSTSFIRINETLPFASVLGLNEDKNRIQLSTCSTGDDGTIDSREISLSDIVNTKNANFTKKFADASKKTDELIITVLPLNTSISKVTSHSGTTVVSYPIMIAPPKKLGYNNLFCTLVTVIDKNGQIKWIQAVPIMETLLSLIDDQDNVHLFANGILNEYEDDVYVGDERRGVNEEIIPIEIILSSETGEILSNTKFLGNGIPDKQAFSFFIGGINFDEKNGFIGIVGQSGQNSLNSRVNNNVTFGHMKIAE
jgi:hypothetical protein